MSRFTVSRTGERNPHEGGVTVASPAGTRSAGARLGEDRPAACGATASGHDDVSRPCPGHRAPTASVDAPISFTYHFPLCRSTTDIPYVISSFDAIPRFPAADPGCSGSCQITVTLI